MPLRQNLRLVSEREIDKKRASRVCFYPREDILMEEKLFRIGGKCPDTNYLWLDDFAARCRIHLRTRYLGAVQPDEQSKPDC